MDILTYIKGLSYPRVLRKVMITIPLDLICWVQWPGYREARGGSLRPYTPLGFFKCVKRKEVKVINLDDSNDELKKIGLRLKSWRKNRRLTGSQFAGKIGFSPGSLSEIENGKSLPSAKTIIQLMKLDGMNITWLLTGKLPENDFLQEKENIIKHLQQAIQKQNEVMVTMKELEDHLLTPKNDYDSQ